MSNGAAHERSEGATRAERRRLTSERSVLGVRRGEAPRSDFRRGLEVLRRSARREPRHAEHPAGNHEPGRAERLRQDDADEPDDRPDLPDHGRILMRGISPRDPEALMRMTGYATQYDTAPRWATGFTFITTGLLLFGYGRSEAEEKAWKALERLGLTEAANRKVAAYSKGMRQRVRLAQAIAHDPDLLVLDEPLNGLDPLVRAETIDLFRSWAAEGKHVIISSHVLQEVDLISDQVVLIANGMIVAEGKIRDVRDEIQEHPSQYIVRCRDAGRIRRGGAAVR